MIPSTEDRNPRSATLDTLATADIVALMQAEEHHVVAALDAAAPAIVRAADAVADAYGAGGRVAYVATGTSGFIAAMDAAELAPTFGADPQRYFALVTSHASPVGVDLRGRREDDPDGAVDAFADLGLGVGDVVVGVAASGTTPIVVGAVGHARARGCTTVGLANSAGAPLLDCDVPVLLDTGPEILTGSTRLKAGTAQKLALNRISTAAMVRLGFVVSNLMVEVRPGNDKLRARCVRIVADVTGTSEADAHARLEACNWSVRDAIGDAGG